VITRQFIALIRSERSAQPEWSGRASEPRVVIIILDPIPHLRNTLVNMEPLR
jgi:hypothetical protein